MGALFLCNYFFTKTFEIYNFNETRLRKKISYGYYPII